MKQILKPLVAALALSCLAGVARADVKPDGGDYQAAPPGTDLLVLYYQHHNADRLNARGRKAADNLNLNLDVGLLRYVHFTKLGGYIIDPQIILPFGRQKVGLADKQGSRSYPPDITHPKIAFTTSHLPSPCPHPSVLCSFLPFWADDGNGQADGHGRGFRGA